MEYFGPTVVTSHLICSGPFSRRRLSACCKNLGCPPGPIHHTKSPVLTNPIEFCSASFAENFTAASWPATLHQLDLGATLQSPARLAAQLINYSPGARCRRRSCLRESEISSTNGRPHQTWPPLSRNLRLDASLFSSLANSISPLCGDGHT